MAKQEFDKGNSQPDDNQENQSTNNLSFGFQYYHFPYSYLKQNSRYLEEIFDC